MSERIIISPHQGFQERFVRANVDVCFGGSSLGSGKTYGEVLAIAEATLDPNWRGLFLRNNLDDIKAGGSIIDLYLAVNQMERSRENIANAIKELSQICALS